LIVAKFEGHSQNITNICFVKNAENLSFISAAGSEVLLWQTPESAHTSNGHSVLEILQPAKILDTESAQSISKISGY